MPQDKKSLRTIDCNLKFPIPFMPTDLLRSNTNSTGLIMELIEIVLYKALKKQPDIGTLQYLRSCSKVINKSRSK